MRSRPISPLHFCLVVLFVKKAKAWSNSSTKKTPGPRVELGHPEGSRVPVLCNTVMRPGQWQLIYKTASLEADFGSHADIIPNLIGSCRERASEVLCNTVTSKRFSCCETVCDPGNIISNQNPFLKLPKQKANILIFIYIIMRSKNEILLDLIGVLFLVWGLLSIYNSLFIFNNPSQIIWFCYIGLNLIGLGILTRNTVLILSQFYILFLPLIIWSLDFIYRLISNKPLFGITDYLFANQTVNLGTLLSLQHLFTIPLIVYVLHLMIIKKNGALTISFIQITLIYIIGVLFSVRGKNVNCIFEPCFVLPFNIGDYYIFLWFSSYVLMIYFAKEFINFLIKKEFLRSF